MAQASLESRRDAELSAILDDEERQAVSYQSTELTKEREQSIKYFYGEPFGNEEDGHSRVVVRDVQDIVEAIMPVLLMKFTGSDNVVEFDPTGPEDEEAAKQRTEYMNYVFNKDNPGFLLLYTVFKDALIQKNGVCKVYYDSKAGDETRTLRGLDDDAYTALLADPDVEIVAHTERPPEQDETEAAAGPSATEAGGMAMGGAGDLAGGPRPMPDASQMMPGAVPLVAPMPPANVHDVKYVKKRGRTCIESIAPEEFLIASRARQLATAPYCADRRRKTLSDLIDEGLVTEAEAMGLGGDDTDYDYNSEAVTRRNITNQGWNEDHGDREGVMREITVTDHYILIDYDGDGVAERRRIITAGSNGNILLNEEWEGPPPYASGSPILIPHRVIGQSLADQVMDLQLIDSTLLRQALDNLYRTNNPRTYLRDGVDLDDYLNPQPGGKVSVPGNPNEYVREATVPFTAGSSLPMLEYLRGMREDRTGVTRYNQGGDADSLNKTATGVQIITNRADMRIDMIARILAETFVKPLFMLIDHCVTKYQNKARVIRINQKWVSIDPRQWESNFDMTVNVGLGTGNKDQQLMHLQTILAIQTQAIQMQGGVNGPLVKLPNIYQTVKKITENAGFKSPEQFWTDPNEAAMQPQQPPPPDPAAMKAQAEIQAIEAKTQAEIQTNQAKTASEIELKRATALADITIKAKTAEAQTEMAAQKQMTDQSMAKERQDGELGLQTRAAQAKAEAEGAMLPDESGKSSMQAMHEFMMAFVERQAERDAKQDQKFEALLRMMTAETQVIRDDKGRVSGSRRMIQ